MDRNGFENLSQLLSESVARFGPLPAIGSKGPHGFEWTSYGELAQLVVQAQGGLADSGVSLGDRVAIVSDNRLEWVVLAFASYALGAVYVPMYEAQSPKEWEFIVRDSGAKLAVGATRDIFERLETIAEGVNSLERVIGLSLPDSHPQGFGRLIQAGAAQPRVAQKVEPGALATLIYTSGTTGTPKGVCLSHGNICSNVLGALERFDFREGDRSLAFLPWAHVFGQTCELYSILAAGASLAINDEIPKLIDNLAVVSPTVLVAVPRIFNRIYERVHLQMAQRPAPLRALFRGALRQSARKRLGEPLTVAERIVLATGDRLIFSKVRLRFGGKLRFVVSGSAALSPAVAQFIDALGIDVFEGYGLTESSPVVAANYPGHKKIGTVGPPFPGVAVRIDASLSDDRAQGEIQVFGPNVMQGYHRDPEATREVFTEDGWLRTGDKGYIDEGGFLRITGRIKEQYKLENGKYVAPAPLEEELRLSPYISNLMIYGENRPYNVAVIVVAVDAISAWAQASGTALSPEIAMDPKVITLVHGELERCSQNFKRYEKVKKFVLVVEDFTTENDLLTPKMSLKRRNLMAKYAEHLERLYRE